MPEFHGWDPGLKVNDTKMQKFIWIPISKLQSLRSKQVRAGSGHAPQTDEGNGCAFALKISS